MGLVLHSYIQPRYSRAGLNPCWGQAWRQNRAASFFPLCFYVKEPALPSVAFCTSANWELLPTLSLSPFPSTAATAAWIWAASDFSQMEKHVFCQQKIWEGGCKKIMVGPLQLWRLHKGNFNSLWTVGWIFWTMGLSWIMSWAEKAFQVCL